MSVPSGLMEPERTRRPPFARFALERRGVLLIAGFIAGTLLLRLPTFFEPPWHSDEGIFQAVAYRVATGGQLYVDAWEAKPPLFLYIYVGLIELFGTGVLPLRFATALSAIGSELAVFAIARRFMPQRQALLAAVLLAFLLAVPFWEGNLAVADTFVLLPASVAVLCFLNVEREDEAKQDMRSALLAGLLFGAAFLIRPTSAVVPAALVLWRLTSARPWFVPGLAAGVGAAAVVLPVVLAFALFGSFAWFWDANVGFFFEYVPSGQELPFHERPVILAPALITVIALVWHRRRGERPRWSLPALWLTFTLSAALLTGRPYSHYMLQIMPPLALVTALVAPHIRVSWRPRLQQAPGLTIAVAIAVLWLAVVIPAFKGNLVAMRYAKAEDYYGNFAMWATGLKSTESYNDYFDRRVNLTNHLDETLEGLKAQGEKVYIWGEIPWLYPLAESQPATRYMTSFYVLLISYLDVELSDTLTAADPRFIVVLGDVWPGTRDDSGVLKWRYRNATRAVNALIARRYEQVAIVGRARVFQRTEERPLVSADAVWQGDSPTDKAQAP